MIWQYLLAAIFILHGLAHLSGFLAAWTRGDLGFPNKPWVFSSRVTLKSPIGKVFGLVWLLAMLALVATGLGIARQTTWWPALVVPAALLSLVVILPWWKSVPLGAWLGAAFDLLVLAGMLWWQAPLLRLVG
jgi:DNA-binding transcriptional LysR family regulator